MSWKLIDHKADIAIEVTGKTPEDIFKIALSALSELVFEKISGSADQEEKIIIEADGFEKILIRFLNELIFYIDSYKYIPVNIKIIELNQNKLKVKVYFAKSGKIVRYIKAATYHNLKMEKIGDNYKIKIIFDV